MKRRADPRRRAMVRAAGGQHGVVSRRQLLAIGFSGDEVLGMLRAQELHPIHRGVYHVGHPAPTRLARHVAANLACGARTAVSHRAAVVLDGLLPDHGGPIDVTTASGNSGRRDGVVVHESRRLAARDVRRVRGIAVVRLEWAMVDVAAGAPAEFARLFDAVDRKRLLDPLRLAGQLRRGRTGSALVRRHLMAHAERPPTESELEDLFHATIVEAHGLPLPVAQSSPLPHRVQRVDFAWPGERVVVELDGREWHAVQAAWGADHERDLALRLAGWRPLRYTHRQLTRAPALVVRDLRNALRPPGGGRSEQRGC